MHDFLERIAKAKTDKALDKILTEVKEVYGFLSNEYNKILNLCWEKSISLRRN